MRIQNGQPKFLQVNVHTFGALYGYNNESGIFDFISGETIEVTDGLDFEVDYPQQVLMVDGHPELFVSNGSHGNWGAPGEFTYKLSEFLQKRPKPCAPNIFRIEIIEEFSMENFFGKFFNPIPTGNGLNQPIYSYHVTQASGNRVNVIAQCPQTLFLVLCFIWV